MDTKTDNAPPAPDKPGIFGGIISSGSVIPILKEVRTPLALLTLIAIFYYALLVPLFDDLTDEHTGFIAIALTFGFLLITAFVAYTFYRGAVVNPKQHQDILENFHMPSPDRMKDTRSRILEGYRKHPEIVSELSVVEILLEKDDQGKPRFEILRISGNGRRFFGYGALANDGIDNVVGKDIGELFSKLGGYSQPPPAVWSDLGIDQERIVKEVFEEGIISYTRVPVKFNRHHPVYPHKTFVPIMTERRYLPGIDDASIIRILYLDVDLLPKNLFTDTVWKKVMEDIDKTALVKEFRGLRENFAKRAESAAFNDDEDRGADRLRNFDKAIEKLNKNGGDPSVLDDLSKVGWFAMRAITDQLEQQGENYRVTKQFVDNVLGSS